MKPLPILLLLGLLLPWLVRDGMFLDGVTYASISRNLAQGLGTFWNPHYTDILYPSFHEHPPLAFGIQSVFFRIFGEGPGTERIYTFFTAILSLFLLAQVWILFAPTRDRKAFWWLPVLLWIVTPVVFWSYRNNMLENTLTVFVLAATWFIGKALLTPRMLWLLPGGLSILLAFLTKGPVGLFPLAIPACYMLAARTLKPGQAILQTLILLAVPLVLFLIWTTIIPEAGESVRQYWQQQVVASVANQRELSEGGRIGILLTLISELSIPLCILVAVSFLGRKSEEKKNTEVMKTGWFFLLIGLAASLPLMISLKQHNYYLTPSIPFYAISICLLIPETERRNLPDFDRRWPWLRWVSLGGLVMVAVVTLLSVNKPGRDQDLLSDVRSITGVMPAGSHISVSDTLCSDWKLIAYFSREANISLDPRTPQPFYLAKKKTALPDSITKLYKPDERELSIYRLYSKKVEGEH